MSIRKSLHYPKYKGCKLGVLAVRRKEQHKFHSHFQNKKQKTDNLEMIKPTLKLCIKSMCAAISTSSSSTLYYYLQLHNISILPFFKKFFSHLLKIFIKKLSFSLASFSVLKSVIESKLRLKNSTGVRRS